MAHVARPCSVLGGWPNYGSRIVGPGREQPRHIARDGEVALHLDGAGTGLFDGLHRPVCVSLCAGAVVVHRHVDTAARELGAHETAEVLRSGRDDR